MLPKTHSKYRPKPLNKIHLKFERYADLRLEDDFELVTLQKHLLRTGPSQWALQEASGRKINLEVYTKCLKLGGNSSWWPYRSVKFLPVTDIKRILTFQTSLARRYCAIGIQDDELLDKGFVIFSSASAKDLDRLLSSLQTINICDAGTVEMAHGLSEMTQLSDQYSSGGASRPTSVLSVEQVTDMDDLSSQCCQVGAGLPPPTPRIDTATDDTYERVATIQCQAAAPPPPRSILSVGHSSSTCAKETQTLYDDVASVAWIDRSPAPQQTPQQTVHNVVESVMPVHSSQPFLPEPPRLRSPKWLEDVQYIRYDPKVGNVLCDEGPVYMYSARQVR